MFTSSLLVTAILAVTDVSITEPADGGTYNGDWLTVTAIVQNENEIPDSVHYSLNGDAVVSIPRLNTDWYTFRGNDLHTGYCESPGPSAYSNFWKASILGFACQFCNEAVVADGIVYYPQSPSGDSLFALDAATGDILWKYQVGYTVDPVTVKNGYVYTASDSLLCLDAYTGERIWSHSKADHKSGTPVVSGGLVYAGTANINGNASRIYCVDALTGAAEWNVPLEGFTASCMTLWNGILFVPTFNGPLYGIDSSNGTVLWKNEQSSLGYWNSSPVVVDGLVYICDFDSNVRAINPFDGTTVWYRAMTPGTYISATPAFHNNRLYFGDQVDSFHCISAGGGSSLWSHQAPAYDSAALADGKAYFSEGSNYSRDTVYFFCLDWNTGNIIWERSYNASLTCSPAISDGLLYTTGLSVNRLCAVGTGLKYTYRGDLFADTGSNQLIVTSFQDGVAAAADTVNFTVASTGIQLDPVARFNLSASPNPFISSASITFELTDPVHTTVEVYDLSGRAVSSLADSYLSAGTHSLSWNGTDQGGEQVAAGLYVCRIESGDVVETTGLCLLK